MLAFNLSAELVYTNVLNCIDLAGAPVRAADRGPDDLLVACGGHCTYNPEPLGLGVDEDTAAIIEPEGRLEILGSGAVTVVNARGMSFTNSYAVNRGQPVAMIGIQVDVLTSGCHYDLHTRRGALAQPDEALLAGRLEEPVETDE